MLLSKADQLHMSIMSNGQDAVSKPKYEFIESPDDIVISGVACRLPESDNMDEFRDHLMKNEDMVTDDSRRYPAGATFKLRYET